jgi:carbamoyl-phosphate synthase large subunit
MSTNILILSAGRRVELVRAFSSEVAKRNLSSKIFATDLKPSLSAACQAADGAINAPRVTDPSYIDFLLSMCKKEGVGLIIPTIDTELLVLSRHREIFSSQGIHLVISDQNLVEICRDKRLTANLFWHIGLDTPIIYEREAIRYPCFAKPYDGSCSMGASVIKGPEAISNSMLLDPKLIFMELIDNSYQEFTVDAYYDREGGLKCFVPRQRIETRAGEVSKGVTRKDHVYNYLIGKLDLIKGARGCITVQLFSNFENGRFAALEINPRFGGGYPLSYKAGANYPGWLIDEYILDKKIEHCDDWERDLLMLRYDTEVFVHQYGG